jgi:hypothetical protein
LPISPCVLHAYNIGISVEVKRKETVKQRVKLTMYLHVVTSVESVEFYFHANWAICRVSDMVRHNGKLVSV